MATSDGHETGATPLDPVADNYLMQGELGSELSYLCFEPEQYDQLLRVRSIALLDDFAPLLQALDRPPEIFPSPAQHYRFRIKLGIGVEPGTGALQYLMWDAEKRPVPVVDFPIASAAINALMPRLLQVLDSSPRLKAGLRAVAFLNTLAKRMLVTLIYKTAINDDDDAWAQEAARHVRDGLGVQVVGRSRGAIVVLDRDYVHEILDLSDGRRLRYKQVEGSFSNPNPYMAISTLNWLCAVAAEITKDRPSADLLEMFCGNGNHTVALAPLFRRVVGVEINRRLVDAAQENLKANGLTNAHIIRIPSEKFRLSMVMRPKEEAKGGGGRRRRRPLATFAVDHDNECVAGADKQEDYDFGAILCDPPRAGLDKYTRRLVSRFDHVLYISCCPLSLMRDLKEGLGSTHEVRHVAVLDHFPYTTHIEMGVHLCRKSSSQGP